MTRWTPHIRLTHTKYPEEITRQEKWRYARCLVPDRLKIRLLQDITTRKESRPPFDAEASILNRPIYKPSHGIHSIIRQEQDTSPSQATHMGDTRQVAQFSGETCLLSSFLLRWVSLDDIHGTKYCVYVSAMTKPLRKSDSNSDST